MFWSIPISSCIIFLKAVTVISCRLKCSKSTNYCKFYNGICPQPAIKDSAELCSLSQSVATMWLCMLPCDVHVKWLKCRTQSCRNKGTLVMKVHMWNMSTQPDSQHSTAIGWGALFAIHPSMTLGHHAATKNNLMLYADSMQAAEKV